jgi:D-beta-D-heptose 7-phosphate kinase/D-beta-D-heptose 1-phosphate adenosyltransferase
MAIPGLLSALAAVDAFCVFSEPTPMEFIVATRPDVLVKGGEYNIDTVVGVQEVLLLGGQLKIVPIVPGFSTTQLIARGAGKEN